MNTTRNRLLLAAATAALLIPASHGAAAAHPATTIADLHQIAVIGSTANIKDTHGNPITVDANPYGVAIAPPGTKGGTLQPGDVVVSNMGATYTGKTLVRFAGGTGPGTLFGATAAGPTAEAFIGAGNDWVANFTGNNVQIFSTNGGAPVFQGAPLNTPAGSALNPLNGDLLLVNQLDNNLVEIGPPIQGNDDRVVAVRTLDRTKVNQKTGAGSALFGLAATADSGGNLKVYFTDDNTNTLDALVMGAPQASALGGNHQGGQGQQGTPSPVATSTTGGY